LSGADEEGGATVRTLVLGMGCILMRDDGVGPSALATFASLYELPDDVELLDIGTPGPELAHQIGGYDALIVFDALRVQSPPGTVRCLTRSEILAAPLLNPRLSPHDPGLREALPAFEQVMIDVALQHTQGRKRDAAELLGWGRNTLTRKLKEVHLPDE